MKVITLNLNGIRSAVSKGVLDWADKMDPDVVCLQEVRAGRNGAGLQHPEGFHPVWHVPERPGYSGVGLWSKQEPESVNMGMGWAAADCEARVVAADFGSTRIVSAYIPSGSSRQERQDFKMKFLARFRRWMGKQAREGKEVLVCGDFNVAHTEKDLCNWRGNRKNSGFLPEERAWMDRLFRRGGWTDLYRHLHPEAEGESYTWWSNRGKAREKNVGWRIDYQVATSGLTSRVMRAKVHQNAGFSDHAPLEVDFAPS